MKAERRMSREFPERGRGGEGLKELRVIGRKWGCKMIVTTAWRKR